jgi:hypothetical protein
MSTAGQRQLPLQVDSRIPQQVSDHAFREIGRIEIIEAQ